jgi:hypothetical protein
MSGTSERRLVPRIPFFTEASLEGLDVSRTDVRIAELSVGGAFVDTRTVLPAGAVARLDFSLGERRMRVTVQVRYAIPSMGMGLVFTDLSEEDRQLLAEFVGVG